MSLFYRKRRGITRRLEQRFCKWTKLILHVRSQCKQLWGKKEKTVGGKSDSDQFVTREKMNGCGLYVTSSSERSKLFQGVSANAFDVVLHRGPGFIAVPSYQGVDDGKMLLTHFDDALRHSPDGKQLRALPEVLDNGGEHGISGCLRDQRMQIAADCAQVFRGRTSTVFYAYRPCPQGFKISNGDLACSAPGCIPLQ